MADIQKSNKLYFPQLTGIRALGACMVYLCHFSPFDNGTILSFPGKFISDFTISLNMFFVLSGFLIYYRYADAIGRNGKGFYQYVVNRVARIYPIYFIFTTIVFVVMYLTNHFPLIKVLGVYFTNITFTRGFFNQLKFSGISQGWSLTVEECFYFLAPVIFFSLKKVNVLFQPIIFILMGCVIVYLFGTPHFYGFMQTYYFMMKYTFFGRCIEFYIGIYIGILFRHKLNNGGITSGRHSLYTYSGITLMIISMTCFALLPQAIEPRTKFIAGLLLTNIIMNGAIGIFFFGLLTETSAARRILSAPLAQVLGKSSYVFYLIHMGLIHNFVASFIPGNGWVSQIAIFIVLNIVAIAVFRLVEEPMNGWVRKVLMRKETLQHN